MSAGRLLAERVARYHQLVELGAPEFMADAELLLIEQARLALRGPKDIADAMREFERRSNRGEAWAAEVD